MTKELAILLRAKGATQAAAGVKSVDSAISGLTRRSGLLGGALSTAQGRLRSFANIGIGVLGVGGLFSFGSALEKSISKAQDWGLQIEKLQGITRNSAESLSGLLAVTEKYGLSNERLAQIAGFTEKALGNLEKGLTGSGLALAGVRGPTDAVIKAQEQLRVATVRLNEVEGKRHTSLSSLVSAQNRVADASRALAKAQAGGGGAVSGAAKFLKDYGFNILDVSGKVKAFDTLLLTFSDYWNGNTAQGLKAAAAAKLFGRGYADLVPILNLGSKGIADAEAEAKALGLTLTQDNVVSLAKAREATRQWGDALSGLELQIGLGLLPALTDLATAATGFVRDHGGEIKQFFLNIVSVGRAAVTTISGIVGALNTAWSGIPAPLREFLTKGLIADRAIKFMFGFSPIGALFKGIEGGLANALGKSIAVAGLGKLFVQPVWVTNPGFGMGGGLPGLPGAAAGAGLPAGAAITIGAVAAAIAGGLLTAGLLAGAAEIVLATSSTAQRNNLAGRQATAAARGLNPANVPTMMPNGRVDPMATFDRGASGGTVAGPGWSIQRAAFLIEHATDRLAVALHGNTAALLHFSPRIKGPVAVVRKLSEIGQAGDPFGFKHLKSFAFGEIPKAQLGPELGRHLTDVQAAINAASAKGDTQTVAKLEETKAGLGKLLGDVKAGTFAAGEREYQGALLVAAAINAKQFTGSFNANFSARDNGASQDMWRTYQGGQMLNKGGGNPFPNGIGPT